MWTACRWGTQLRDSPGFAPEFPFNAVGAARHGNKTRRKGKKKTLLLHNRIYYFYVNPPPNLKVKLRQILK
jgi:hypothetical protein